MEVPSEFQCINTWQGFNDFLKDEILGLGDVVSNVRGDDG